MYIIKEFEKWEENETHYIVDDCGLGNPKYYVYTDKEICKTEDNKLYVPIYQWKN